MADNDLHKWLMDEGGAPIRYRTATELPDAPGPDVAASASDLLADPMTQSWLERLGAPGGLTSLHSSQPTAFENAASKLCDLGLHAGMAPLDERMAPYLQWLDERAAAMDRTSDAVDDAIHHFETVVVAARVAWLGYDTPALRRCLATRLDTVYDLAQTGDHDIYIDQDTFGDYPDNAFRKKPLIDPRFNGRLPSIHDVYALAHLPPALMDAEKQHKIDTVIDYILHPDYQALREGYGTMRVGPRRYYSMGWSVHLPGYGGDFSLDRTPAATLVQRLELMAHFPTARAHRWFGDASAHLAAFRDEAYNDVATYRFPAGYLRESAGGYWVSGAYMRLEDNRRRRIALTLDSTFRFAYIRHLAQDTTGFSFPPLGETQRGLRCLCPALLFPLRGNAK